ncbi:MAG TPA: D-alanyl-D-alanine carboxypeptidase/D-alanyl-D-alanine-endopeptidase, partial [Gemmatimonadaceae bacterium]|nr:D-alanyl-D-alanine carboxypeptidase/D-alanyl-D-alanine-endopeptidase [Gemmatimonadaceae bacterium]
AETPAPVDPRVALRQSIDSAVNDARFANAFWGILIVDPTTGDTLYSHNAGKLFLPASNQKIITGATALAQLGADYTFRTVFAARGVVRDSTLRGDLVVIGRGDPTISDHMRKDAMEPLRALADSLRAHGIARIAGRLVSVGDALPGPALGYGWDWDDLDYGYGAGVDELLFNEGFTLVTVHAGAEPGAPLRVETKPTKKGPKVRVTATTVAMPTDSGAKKPSLVIRWDSLSGGALVEGAIAAGDSADEEVAHRVPKQAYLDALAEALGDRGIQLRGGKSDSTARVDTLFTLVSPPLREILPALEKPSQNQIAEILYRTLGLEKTGVGSADSARRVVERQLAAWGAKPEGAAVRDGSGLSRHDYVSPETLVRVLAAIRGDTAFHVFYDALPIAGVDGTIERRMKGTPAEGNVHAKTGSVDKARSLSGYATTADGRMLIFSALCNNWTVPVRQVEAVQDMIGARLAALTLGAPATH